MTTAPLPPEPEGGQDGPPHLRLLLVALTRLLTDLGAHGAQPLTEDQRLRIGALLAALRRFRKANQL